ncbi:MAG: hypothetical protein COW52_08320 [Nitrospirae bacterium CG17_big_fil_post_rev_8_21_14_2_50_50_9]|nr:MAG: hypothetical protein COW52_08320 [Nitrospirae bacterium CG17_big_fil_post_rev_8_21_14_2_50_50_9]
MIKIRTKKRHENGSLVLLGASVKLLWGRFLYDSLTGFHLSSGFSVESNIPLPFSSDHKDRDGA